MKTFNIAVVSGDGIGPEVTSQAVRAMKTAGEHYGLSFHFNEVSAGGAAIDEYGECLPQHTIDVCKSSDAVLLGAVGGPKWDDLPGEQRPEKALLRLRKSLGLYANLRPAMVFPELAEESPLKPDILKQGLDLLIVRELTGGIYFGERGAKETDMGYAAYDVEQYSVGEIERITKIAFNMAKKRRGKVTSVDKANVLDTSRLWRNTVTEMAESEPDIELNHFYVDNASMQLVRDPSQFDVILTSNLFGDILSDEASQITGSIGMLPSASLGEEQFGMYEPVHGSAPDIAGSGKANPIAAILSAAMLLRFTLNQNEAADAIENAVRQFLADGLRTADLSKTSDYLTTEQAGSSICDRIK